MYFQRRNLIKVSPEADGLHFVFEAEAELFADEKSGYSVSGGTLNGSYYAGQFHFHWGNNDSLGSEHLIDGNPHPLEVRIPTPLSFPLSPTSPWKTFHSLKKL